MERDHIIASRIPIEMKKELDKIAEDQERSLGWIVRKALESYLGKKYKKVRRKRKVNEDRKKKIQSFPLQIRQN